MTQHPSDGFRWLNWASWLWLVAGLGLGGYLIASGSTADTELRSASDQLASVAAQTPASHATRKIEDIRVGMRVMAENPEVTPADRASWREPDWADWLKLTVVMPKPDGSEVTIEMLRPESWVVSQTRILASQPQVNFVESPPVSTGDVQSELAFGPLRPAFLHLSTQIARAETCGLRTVGLTVDLDLPELGLTGAAALVALEPAPPIDPGTGRVVTEKSKGDRRIYWRGWATGVSCGVCREANGIRQVD